MADTDIRPILDPLPVDQQVKAEAWNHFTSATSPEDFQARFDKMNIPVEAKAALWNAKFNPGAAPVKPALTGPALSSTNPAAGNLPSAAEADAEATRKAKAYADQLTQQAATGGLPGPAKPSIPGFTGPNPPSSADDAASLATKLGTNPDGAQPLNLTQDGTYDPINHLTQVADYIGDSIPRTRQVPGPVQPSPWRKQTKLYQTSTRGADEPLVNASKILPSADEIHAMGLGPEALTAVEGVRGITDLASQLTSAKNVAILATTKGAGNLIEGAGKAEGAYKAAAAGLSGYFASEMFKSVAETWPELKKAVDEKDYPTAARLITGSLGQLVLAGFATKHIKDTIQKGNAAMDSTLTEHNAAADTTLKAEQQTGKEIANADQVAKTVAQEPIGVTIDGKAARIEANSPTEGGGGRKASYKVVDAESGDVLHAGTGPVVSDFLRAKGVKPITEAPLETPPAIEQKVGADAAAPKLPEMPAAETTAPEAPAAAAKLPRELGGAQPRYNYGSKAFTLSFESDADKAAYIAAQEKPSKRDADYLKFGMEATGLSEEDLSDRGRQIKAGVKEQAKGADAGALTVPKFAAAGEIPETPFDAPPPAESAPPAEKARQAKIEELTAIAHEELAAQPDSSVRAPTTSEIQEAAQIVAKEHADAQEQPAASEESGESDSERTREVAGGEEPGGGEVRQDQTAGGASGAEGQPEAQGATGLPDESGRSGTDERVAAPARVVAPTLNEQLKAAVKAKDVPAIKAISAKKLAAKKAELDPDAVRVAALDKQIEERTAGKLTGSQVNNRAWLKNLGEERGNILKRRPDLAPGKSEAVPVSNDTGGAAETGPRGPIFRQFHHDAPGAIEKLQKEGSGEAIAALHHPEVGDIDLVWGEKDTPGKEGHGLAKIIDKHSEVMPDLQGFISKLHVDESRSGPNRKILVSANKLRRAAVRLDWDGESKNWLLSAYDKNAGKGAPPSAGGTTDVPGSSVARSGETTASPDGGSLGPLSTGRSTGVSGNPVSEAGETSSPGSGAPDKSMEPAGKEVNSKGDSALKQFLADESGTFTPGALGSILANDLAEMGALKAKRDAATAQLKKAREDPAGAQSADALAEAYMANRDLWSTRVNQVMDRLRKMVPDHVDQEALSIMRDFTKRSDLKFWLDGTHPVLHDLDPEARATAMKNIERLRPAIERAQDPTPNMQAANYVLTQIAEASAKEAENRGMIEKGLDPERYFTHLLHPKGEGDVPTSLSERIGKAMGGKIGRRYAFSQHRSYPTVLDAIADNVKPKTLNAFDAFTIHGDKFATARATHLLLDHLQDSKMGVWNTMKGKDVPENWVKLAPHSDEFHNEIPVTDAEGKPQIANQALWVHPAVARAMRPITDPDYMHVVKGFTNMRARQALLKQANLSMSLFHARALNIMALGNMGPKGWARGLRADRTSPEFETAERDMVLHGGTSPIQGRNIEAYKSLEPGSMPSWGDVWRHAPVLAEVDRAAQAISRLTFDNLQRKFKVTDYQVHSAGWMADHPDATAQELHAAKTSIAKEINAVYGGLNWERLGINHASIEVARAIVLAPDWSFSNIFNVKYATEGGPKAATHQAASAIGLRRALPPSWEGPPAGKLARAFWVKTILGGLAATQLMSLLFTGQTSKKLTQVYMGKDKQGKDIHQNMFFAGAPQDATTLINNVEDYGAFVGTARTMANKTAPGLHVAMDLMKNEDFLGRPIVRKGMHPVASTVRGGLYLAKGLAPIPYSMQNMKDMLIGPGSETFQWWEAPAALFSGSAPRHSGGEGMRGQRANRSIWEQIKTGKL